jgi:hypothetical protein
MENTVARFGSLVKILCAGVDPRPAETVVVVSGPITAPDDKRCVMAKYMLLIHGDEREWESMTPEQWKAHGDAHAAFRAAAGSRVIGGEQLALAETATTVRADPAGGLVTTDGPFLETKEAVGGYYLVEAKDLDEVLALVAKLPEVRASHSGVEIRPVVEHG